MIATDEIATDEVSTDRMSADRMSADEPGYPCELADLRRVPLAEIPDLGESMLNGAVQRLVPESLANQVPVAAFNSAI
jgi:FXSXX-COOH protein